MSIIFLVQPASLSQGVGHGTHRYGVAASGLTARTTGRTPNVQVRNNIRDGITGGEGFGCSAQRSNL